MTIQLTPQSEELIRRLTVYGDDRDAGAVIEEALRLLEEQRRFERLTAAINKGFDSLDRGEGAVLTPELREQMKRNALRKVQDREWRPDPDVCPKTPGRRCARISPDNPGAVTVFGVA